MLAAAFGLDQVRERRPRRDLRRLAQAVAECLPVLLELPYLAVTARERLEMLRAPPLQSRHPGIFVTFFGGPLGLLSLLSLRLGGRRQARRTRRRGQAPLLRCDGCLRASTRTALLTTAAGLPAALEAVSIRSGIAFARAGLEGLQRQRGFA